MNPVMIFQLIALSPVLWWFGTRLDDGGGEPLGLLTLGLAVALAWRDRGSLRAGKTARVWGAVLMLVSVLAIPWLPPMIRAALALAGIGCCHGFHRRAGLMGLLVLSLPVMASMQFFIGYPMRIAAAEGAVRLLELGSGVVSREGTQIMLGGQSIGVDPACAGVRMLWHALAAAMALAAIHRLSWRATMIGGVMAVALVIPANAVRAALLAAEESGHGLGHGGTGLAGFAILLVPLWWAISSRARPPFPPVETVAPGRMEIGVLACAAALAPALMWTKPRAPSAPVSGTVPADFTFQGVTRPLRPLPPSEAEKAFSSGFPGTLSSHRWGDGQVILRRVGVATRRLHASRDCLRAAGFTATEAITVDLRDGSRWARFRAAKGDLRLTVHERIASEGDGSTWTDVSAWYWSALGRPLNGPWRAETVISIR